MLAIFDSNVYDVFADNEVRRQTLSDAFGAGRLRLLTTHIKASASRLTCSTSTWTVVRWSCRRGLRFGTPGPNPTPWAHIRVVEDAA